MPADVAFTRPAGGYFIGCACRRQCFSMTWRRARERNVYFSPGTGFFVNPADGAHHLRLSFSFVPLDDLRAGIEILGNLIAEMSA